MGEATSVTLHSGEEVPLTVGSASIRTGVKVTYGSADGHPVVVLRDREYSCSHPEEIC